MAIFPGFSGVTALGGFFSAFNVLVGGGGASPAGRSEVSARVILKSVRRMFLRVSRISIFRSFSDRFSVTMWIEQGTSGGEWRLELPRILAYGRGEAVKVNSGGSRQIRNSIPAKAYQ